jgi:hypothetical protein
VLADDHRALLSILDTLGQQQDSTGNHVREDIHDDLVAGVLRIVEDLARPRVRLQERLVEPADDPGGKISR